MACECLGSVSQRRCLTVLKSLVTTGHGDVRTGSRFRLGKGLVHFTVDEKFRVSSVHHYIRMRRRWIAGGGGVVQVLLFDLIPFPCFYVLWLS